MTMGMKMLSEILPEDKQSGIFYDNVPGESIDGKLIGRKFILHEYFCDNTQCDCESVVVSVEEVCGTKPDLAQLPLAAIRYDWSVNSKVIELDEEHAQSSFAPAILEWYKKLVENSEYIARLILKYKLFKAWCIINELDGLHHGAPVIKIGRNDPCPCNSGKKYKKCCLNKNNLQTVSPNLMEDNI